MLGTLAKVFFASAGMASGNTWLKMDLHISSIYSNIPRWIARVTGLPVECALFHPLTHWCYVLWWSPICQHVCLELKQLKYCSLGKKGSVWYAIYSHLPTSGKKTSSNWTDELFKDWCSQNPGNVLALNDTITVHIYTCKNQDGTHKLFLPKGKPVSWSHKIRNPW
jgi:hypothetical protein